MPIFLMALGTALIPLAAVMGWKANDMAEEGGLHIIVPVGEQRQDNGAKVLALAAGALVALKLYRGR